MATKNEVNTLACEVIDYGGTNYEIRRNAALTMFDLVAERTNLLDLLRAARKYVPGSADGLGIKIDATLSVYTRESEEEAARLKLRTESMELSEPPRTTD